MLFIGLGLELCTTPIGSIADAIYVNDDNGRRRLLNFQFNNGNSHNDLIPESLIYSLNPYSDYLNHNKSQIIFKHNIDISSYNNDWFKGDCFVYKNYLDDYPFFFIESPDNEYIKYIIFLHTVNKLDDECYDTYNWDLEKILPELEGLKETLDVSGNLEIMKFEYDVE